MAGPNGDGVSESRNLPVKWSKTENVLWSAELPGYRTDSHLYCVGTAAKR